MSTSSSSQLGEAAPVGLNESFCSYCGYPPRGVWRDRPHRTCRRCGLGVMLSTPTDGVPRRDPFLIVDEQMMVQAISRHAEAVLSVDEPAGVRVPLDEFLVTGGDAHEQAELARLVNLAAAGKLLPTTLQLR